MRIGRSMHSAGFCVPFPVTGIVDALAPALVTRNSIGDASAARLVLAAGDNSERLHSGASFAALCGVMVVPASSGKVTRHRLGRVVDRAADSALDIVAIGRLRTDRRTLSCISPRLAEGHCKLVAIGWLKRCIARAVFFLIS